VDSPADPSGPSPALLLVDLQNDFLHPDGAYARGGVASPELAALPARLAPLADRCRHAGIPVIATLFTVVDGGPGRRLLGPHLAALRPFLADGGFDSGSWGQAVVDELTPVDLTVEKVAYSAFYASRLEFVLRRLGVDRLWVAGIVTNGGVASTVRDAHVRDLSTVVISDGCGAFSPEAHQAALGSLGTVSELTTIAELAASESVSGP
jgi:nicotinamidase-related amidase